MGKKHYYRMPSPPCDLVRSDGLKMSYDPYTPDMIAKYGAPGQADHEGFDPYSDTVGPGIYGGRVKRNEHGEVIMGRQYQGHNSRPGPVYAGGGYTPMSNALRLGEKAIKPLLEKYPDLVNEISTGGATPLHMCGMGTYNYTPLHRMASNNLVIGARALLEAGTNLNVQTDRGETAKSIAREAGAIDVLKILKEFDTKQ